MDLTLIEPHLGQLCIEIQNLCSFEDQVNFDYVTHVGVLFCYPLLYHNYDGKSRVIFEVAHKKRCTAIRFGKVSHIFDG